jgi:hypothetical protein
MIYQIAGTVLVCVCIICFTWYRVTARRDAEKNRERVRRQREARNERVYSNGSMSLYMETISVEEVARLLGVNPQLGFPASRIGARTIIPKKAFYEWCKEEAQ